MSILHPQAKITSPTAFLSSDPAFPVLPLISLFSASAPQLSPRQPLSPAPPYWLSDRPVYVKTAKAGYVKVSDSASVLQSRRKVQAKEGIAPSMQRLIFGGKQLEDDRQLKECKISNGSTIFMLHWLCGGMNENDDNFATPWQKEIGDKLKRSMDMTEGSNRALGLMFVMRDYITRTRIEGQKIQKNINKHNNNVKKKYRDPSMVAKLQKEYHELNKFEDIEGGDMRVQRDLEWAAKLEKRALSDYEQVALDGLRAGRVTVASTGVLDRMEAFGMDYMPIVGVGDDTVIRHAKFLKRKPLIYVPGFEESEPKGKRHKGEAVKDVENLAERSGRLGRSNSEQEETDGKSPDKGYLVPSKRTNLS